MAHQEFTLSDLIRRLTNLAVIGTVVMVDYARARAQVDLGGRVSGWLPIPAAMGRNWRGANPMRIGTQVLVVSPCGDPAQGVIAQILYADALPPTSDNPILDQVRFDDGTTVTYDSASHSLTVHAVGPVTVNAAGPVRVEGEDVTLHARQSYSWDVDGYGQRITSTGGGSYTIHTWQQGATVTSQTSSIKQPEGP